MKDAADKHLNDNARLNKLPKNLMNALNIHVLDFDDKLEHTVYLNCIKYKDKEIYFKNPLKIRIKKQHDLFYLFEDNLGLVVAHKSFQKSLDIFQKKFYRSYIQYKDNNTNHKFFQELNIR